MERFFLIFDSDYFLDFFGHSFLRNYLSLFLIGNAEALKKLVNSQNVNSLDDETGKTALHFAAEYDLDDIAEILIKNEANVNAVDKDLNTPLHYAAKHGFYHVFFFSLINLQKKKK